MLRVNSAGSTTAQTIRETPSSILRRTDGGVLGGVDVWGGDWEDDEDCVSCFSAYSLTYCSPLVLIVSVSSLTFACSCCDDC